MYSGKFPSKQVYVIKMMLKTSGNLLSNIWCKSWRLVKIPEKFHEIYINYISNHQKSKSAYDL